MTKDYAYFRMFLFFCATVMSVLPAVSIQNPRLSTMDIFRIQLQESGASNISEVRFGLWSFCLHRTSLEGNSTICDSFSPCNLEGSLRLCSEQKYGYHLTMTAPGNSGESKSFSPAWTRPLVAHAALAIMMVICLFLLVINRPSLGIYTIAIIVAVVTFFCDAAIDSHLKALTKQLKHMQFGEKYVVGPGFVLQLIASVWLGIETYIEFKTDEDLDEPPLPTTFVQYRHSTSPHYNYPVTLVHRDGRLESSRPKVPSPITRPEVARTRPHRKATDGLPGRECPICLERKKGLSELPCKHVFCTECISKSMSMYGRCPLCNRIAKHSDLSRVSLSSFV